MKLITALFLITFCLTAYAQEPSKDTVVTAIDSKADTVDLYVINNTSRFVALPSEGNTKFSFFYRDLKFLRTLRELKFQNRTEVEKFFATCEKALATDKTFITQGYNISRNRVNKNVIRLNNKQDGYTLLKRETFEFIKTEFYKYVGE